jgi:tRNA-binding protein|tara:strand:+ start:55 stop:381 length:327 start_codon:yes stop_codon:yes gene_type:complete
MIDYSTFEKLDLRVGTILSAKDFPKAKKPAYKLEIDFGPIGILKSSAQITNRYSLEELLGKQIIAVVNIGIRKIADFESQCLVLGATENNEVILLSPESEIPNGEQIL